MADGAHPQHGSGPAPRTPHPGLPQPSAPDEQALANVVVVLDEPQNTVNVAAVIRAMMNMGLTRLRLVRPLDFDPHRVEGIAHRSTHLVGATELYDSLTGAVADAVFVAGTSARPRSANRNYARPRAVANSLVERARRGTVCLLFGREDRGLTNAALDLCNVIITIPTAPDHRSLNLAQACLLISYELFLAAGGGKRTLPRGRRATDPATREELESMYSALENGLARIHFFKGARQPASVLRTLRTALERAELDGREARLVRAIAFEIGHYPDRSREGEDRKP